MERGCASHGSPPFDEYEYLVALYSNENTRLQNESPSCTELIRTGVRLEPLIATGHGASGTWQAVVPCANIPFVYGVSIA